MHASMETGKRHNNINILCKLQHPTTKTKLLSRNSLSLDIPPNLTQEGHTEHLKKQTVTMAFTRPAVCVRRDLLLEASESIRKPRMCGDSFSKSSQGHTEANTRYGAFLCVTLWVPLMHSQLTWVFSFCNQTCNNIDRKARK